MRLFTAVDLEAQTVRALAVLLLQLKPVARLRWSPVENLHITTKFIGEWPADRLADLRQCLPQGNAAPDVVVNGWGFFPNDRFPKVLFARVEPNPALHALAAATDLALGAVGVPHEKHPYRPHITLARIPDAVYLHPLKDRLEELKPARFGSFQAASYSLFESRAGSYSRLESFQLAEAS